MIGKKRKYKKHKKNKNKKEQNDENKNEEESTPVIDIKKTEEVKDSLETKNPENSNISKKKTKTSYISSISHFKKSKIKNKQYNDKNYEENLKKLQEKSSKKNKEKKAIRSYPEKEKEKDKEKEKEKDLNQKNIVTYHYYFADEDQCNTFVRRSSFSPDGKICLLVSGVMQNPQKKDFVPQILLQCHVPVLRLLILRLRMIGQNAYTFALLFFCKALSLLAFRLLPFRDSS